MRPEQKEEIIVVLITTLIRVGIELVASEIERRRERKHRERR